MKDLKSLISTLKGVTQDSRAVKNGYLYAAFPGKKVDGRDYIADAIMHGAKIILVPEDKNTPSLHGLSVQSMDEVDYTHKACNDEPVIISSPNPRKAFAHIVAGFYAQQPTRIVAVTGTNGKTSIVHFAQQLWEKAGLKASSLGTLQGGMTTPSPAHLHANLADLNAAGVTHLALEASSHGLDQYRLDGVEIKAAGFTNLSRDHLDYHKDMEEYFTAKARLFSEVMKPGGTAVLNADTPEGQKLAEISKSAGHTIWTYGFKGKDLKIISCEPVGQGQKLTLEIFGKHYDLTLPLVGKFQAMNALCALGLVLAEKGRDQDQLVKFLESLKGAPGRLQFVGGHPKNAAVYVDYAHTPDALENVLNALRPHTHGKLICVFGCGGDRDKGKRPVMGEIAAKLADQAIVTDDNPRGEDPSSIRAAILQGAKTATEIADRRKAIQHTISNLEKGDVLLVAGKGHEQGQIFADRTDPFDDVTEVQTAIRNLSQPQHPMRHPAT